MFDIYSNYNSAGEHGELRVLAWLFDTPSWWFRAIFSGYEKETALKIRKEGGRPGWGMGSCDIGRDWVESRMNVLWVDEEIFLELRASI